MLMSAVLLPLGDFLSHGIAALAQVQAEHRPSLLSQHDDHGHIHDSVTTDLEPGGHSHGHNHGHDSFDHSHEVAHLTADLALQFPVVPEAPEASLQPRIVQRFPPLPDRPPMRVTLA